MVFPGVGYVPLDLLLTLGVGLALVWILAMVLPPTGLLTVGYLIWGLNMSPFLVDVGDIGMALGGVLILYAARKERKQTQLRTAAPRLVWILVVTAAVGLVLLPMSVDLGESVRALLGLLWLALIVVIVAQRVPGPMLARAAWMAMLVYVIASYLLAYAGVGAGIGSSQRWTGVVSNPNALGILAMLTVAVSFGVSTAAIIVSLPLCAGLIFFSASRGSAIGMAAAIVAGLWVNQMSTRTARKWVVRSFIAAALAIGVLAVESVLRSTVVVATSDDLIRDADSGRLSLIKVNLELFAQNPLGGFGVGVKAVGEIPGAHFFPVVMAVQLGIAGLAIAIWMIVVFLRTPWRRDPMIAALVASCLVSLAAESWVFGTGYLMTVAFWTVLAAQVATVRAREHPVEETLGMPTPQPAISP